MPPLVERLHGDMMKAGSNLARRLADLALLQRKGTAIVALRNLAAQHAENQASIAKASIIFKNLLLQRECMQSTSVLRQGQSCRWSSFSKMACGHSECKIWCEQVSDGTPNGICRD